MRLERKVAIVTGGGTGIGAATARRFASEGASVIVTGRRPEPIAAVAGEIGGLAVSGDAADPAHVEEAVATARERFGGLDVVVANAGAGFGGRAGDVDDERWRRTIDVNLSAPFLLVRAAIPLLEERGGGSIVVVSSVSGLVSAAGSAAYVASKAGAIALAKSIAVDYGPIGIRANAVCPGWVRTEIGDRAVGPLVERHGVSLDEAYRIATATLPLRRAAYPDEIAACCLFLASEESSFVTGTVLLADGGTTAVDPGGLALDLPDRSEPTS